MIFRFWVARLNVVNQTPLTAIKSLIGTPTVEAVVQTSHDGKLIIRREFPVSPNKWHEVVADHTVIDDGGVFSDSDNRDVMPGYNYVEISDQEAADSSKRLESENISDTTKRVRGYSVPWDDDFPLDTSGGSWVAIVDNGVLVERVTETWKNLLTVPALFPNLFMTVTCRAMSLHYLSPGWRMILAK